MFKRLPKKISIVILCIFSPLTYGEASNSSIDMVLDLSGLTQQVNQFPGLIKEGMKQARQQGAPISNSAFSTMLLRTDDTILASEIIEEVRSSLKKALTEQDIQQLLLWYESDLGKEITALEENAATPEAYNQMMQQSQALLSNSERVERAKRFDKFLGVTELTMDIQEYSSVAIFSAITLALRPDSATSEIKKFKAQMIAMRPQIRVPTEQIVIVSFVYMYLTLDNFKLKEYELFLTDPTTSKFNKIVASSLNRGLEKSIDKWAFALGRIFSNKEQQS